MAALFAQAPVNLIERTFDQIRAATRTVAIAGRYRAPCALLARKGGDSPGYDSAEWKDGEDMRRPHKSDGAPSCRLARLTR
jgi:hypothetical protein